MLGTRGREKKMSNLNLRELSGQNQVSVKQGSEENLVGKG